MLKLNSVMLGTSNLQKLRDFYQQVFNQKPDWEDEGYVGFGSQDLTLVIGTHSEVEGKNKNPAQIMINLTTNEVQSEFDRLVNLGAKVIAKPYAMDGSAKAEIATLADPDGNYLQLMLPM